MATEVFIPKMTDFMEEAVIGPGWWRRATTSTRASHCSSSRRTRPRSRWSRPATGYLVGIRPDIIAGATIPVGTTIAYIAESPDERVEELESIRADARNWPGRPEWRSAPMSMASVKVLSSEELSRI